MFSRLFQQHQRSPPRVKGIANTPPRKKFGHWGKVASVSIALLSFGLYCEESHLIDYTTRAFLKLSPLFGYKTECSKVEGSFKERRWVFHDIHLSGEKEEFNVDVKGSSIELRLKSSFFQFLNHCIFDKAVALEEVVLSDVKVHFLRNLKKEPKPDKYLILVDHSQFKSCEFNFVDKSKHNQRVAYPPVTITQLTLAPIATNHSNLSSVLLHSHGHGKIGDKRFEFNPDLHSSHRSRSFVIEQMPIGFLSRYLTFPLNVISSAGLSVNAVMTPQEDPFVYLGQIEITLSDVKVLEEDELLAEVDKAPKAMSKATGILLASYLKTNPVAINLRLEEDMLESDLEMKKLVNLCTQSLIKKATKRGKEVVVRGLNSIMERFNNF